jgi:hypothetical protein
MGPISPDIPVIPGIARTDAGNGVTYVDPRALGLYDVNILVLTGNNN